MNPPDSITVAIPITEAPGLERLSVQERGVLIRWLLASAEKIEGERRLARALMETDAARTALAHVMRKADESQKAFHDMVYGKGEQR